MILSYDIFPLAEISLDRYFMYEPFIDPSGPSLGSLKVHLRYQSSEGDLVTLPVWGLRNHQGPNWMYGQAKVQVDQDFVVSVRHG